MEKITHIRQRISVVVVVLHVRIFVYPRNSSPCKAIYLLKKEILLQSSLLLILRKTHKLAPTSCRMYLYLEYFEQFYSVIFLLLNVKSKTFFFSYYGCIVTVSVLRMALNVFYELTQNIAVSGGSANYG